MRFTSFQSCEHSQFFGESIASFIQSLKPRYAYQQIPFHFHSPTLDQSTAFVSSLVWLWPSPQITTNSKPWMIGELH